MRAVGIETDEISKGVELPTSDVVVTTVRVDLKVVHMTGVAKEGDGIVPRQLYALTD